MKTEIIAETWHALGNRQTEFVEAFYARFFERFPAYLRFFPKTLKPSHLDKIVAAVLKLITFPTMRRSRLDQHICSRKAASPG